jgi:hypothetical protein
MDDETCETGVRRKRTVFRLYYPIGHSPGQSDIFFDYFFQDNRKGFHAVFRVPISIGFFRIQQSDNRPLLLPALTSKITKNENETKRKCYADGQK